MEKTENKGSVTTNSGMSLTPLKAMVIGGSGGVGRDLVTLLLNSKYFSKVTVIARRKVDAWKTLTEDEEKKFNFVKVEDLEFLTKEKEEIEKALSNDTEYDSVFCCLGSRGNKSKEEYFRVEFDYVNGSAGLCEKFKIPHFSMISSMGADPKSWFQILNVKGKAENEVLKKDVKYSSIFRVGGILNTDNDPWIASFIKKWVPFVPKIHPTDFAQAILNDSVLYHVQNQETNEKEFKNFNKIYLHKEIETLSKVNV